MEKPADINHRPVMPAAAVAAVLAARCPYEVNTVVDATFGGGGHSRLLLAKLPAAQRLLAMDCDEMAAARAAAVAREVGGDGCVAAVDDATAVADDFTAADDDVDAADATDITHIDSARFIFRRRNYAELTAVLAQLQIASVRAVLFDLGVSSMQLENMSRGFSLHSSAAPDMRMDRRAGVPLSEWLVRADEDEIYRAIKNYGEEPEARRVARRLWEKRGAIATCRQLAETVAAAKKHRGKPGIHPATQVFQALRIAVNSELKKLQIGLAAAVSALAVGGRLVVIAFHSLEDRIVKQLAGGAAFPGIGLIRHNALRPLGKMQRASAAEVSANPRARSARLRVFEKTEMVAA